MTTQQKMDLAKVILPAVAGAAGSYASSRQQNTQNQIQQQQNAQSVQQLLQQMRQNQAQAGLNAMPLGLEQQYLQKQRMMQALLPALASFKSARPTDPGILGAYKPGSNVLGQLAGNPQFQQTFNDSTTEQSLANYRKMVGQVDPRMSIGSLSALGLSGSQDQSVRDVLDQALRDQQAFEAQQQNQQPQSTAEPPKKKGGGIWGKIGSIAKVAVPIVLAATGVGIPAAMAITAGTNIAASKMQGKDWGDALQSGVVGAATGAVGAGALGSGARAGISAGTQKAIAQGVLSGADSKMQGGSWNEALQSGMGGAAMSKVGDMAKAKFQNGSSNGLNNGMTQNSLPLGSQNMDGNNPMTAWKSVLKTSPSLQLGSQSMSQGRDTQPLQQPVQANSPQNLYPMENKVKAAVTGISLKPGQMQGFGSVSPQQGATPPVQSGPPQGQNPMALLQQLQDQRKQWEQSQYHKAYSNTAQTVPSSQQTGMPQLQRGLPGETFSNEMYQRWQQNPLVTTLNSPGGMIAGAALTGQVGSQMQTAQNNQQNIANILAQLSKNGGVNNAEFNMAAQNIYKGVPGTVTQEMNPGLNTQLNAQNILRTLGANNGMTTGGRAALNATPEAQNIFNQLQGTITKQLTPEQLAQIIARNAKTRMTVLGR